MKFYSTPSDPISQYASALNSWSGHSLHFGCVGSRHGAKCKFQPGARTSQEPREAHCVGKNTPSGLVWYWRIAVQKIVLTRSPDHIFRQTLSSTAKRADEIVQAMRQFEIDNYWRVAATADGSVDERFAGEAFPLARPLIANTTLWDVVKRMPKGALLHAHLSAMLPYEKLLEIIIQTEGMEISVSQPIDTDEAKKNATITFSHNNGTVTTNESRIDSADYTPNTQIPIKTAVANFEGGEAGFIEFIYSRTTIPPDVSIRHELGVDEIWRRFQACFGPTDTMIQYEPVVRKFYQKLFEDLAKDGVNWVEIRSGGSSGKLVHDGDEDVDPDLDAWWHVLVEEIEKFKATEAGKKFLGARVIWSDARGKSRTAITKSMNNPGRSSRI